MNIIQITPAGRDARGGNRTTAERWARIWKRLGHRVRTSTRYDGVAADLMVALHARHSHADVLRFRQCHPERPLVLTLTGTDINEYLHTEPDRVLEAMAGADILVGLHDLVAEIIPAQFRPRLRVIHQSAPGLPAGRNPGRRHFGICVVGNLRRVKDPLRTALAVRDLPQSSRIRVIHLGAASDQALLARAQREMRDNPRYHWLGGVPSWRVRREYARARLFVISSLSEGGANALSEAIVAGLPVVASRIDGNAGLLGREYQGYYPPGDTGALRRLLLRAEQDPAFLDLLTRQCSMRRRLFTPEREQRSWDKLLRELA